MDAEVFNQSVRKFLKKVGVTSQRELEQRVQAAIASGKLKGNETLGVRVRLETDLGGEPLEIDGKLELE